MESSASLGPPAFAAITVHHDMTGRARTLSAAVSINAGYQLSIAACITDLPTVNDVLRTIVLNNVIFGIQLLL